MYINTQILPTILLLLATLCMGCNSDQKREYFAANGITIGEPVPQQKQGTYEVPIAFKTQIVHSARGMHKVRSRVVGKEIHISADHRLKGSGYGGSITIQGAAAGEYTIKYRDPNGTLHPIGPVTLP